MYTHIIPSTIRCSDFVGLSDRFGLMRRSHWGNIQKFMHGKTGKPKKTFFDILVKHVFYVILSVLSSYTQFKVVSMYLCKIKV